MELSETIVVRLSKKEMHELDILCDMDGVSRSQAIRNLIKMWSAGNLEGKQTKDSKNIKTILDNTRLILKYVEED